MVEIAQVAAEPDEGGSHGGRTGRRTPKDYNAADTMNSEIESVSLANHFLIAMPGMTDPNFAHTLTFLCEHNQEGALGIVVNRPLDLNLATLFERVSVELAQGPQRALFENLPVYFGGPVQTDRGFVLHRPLGDWQSTLSVDESIGLTSSRDILQAMSERGEPEDVLVTLGYAGWAAGQLEWELSQNAWLTVAANPEILFALPAEERLPAALQLLGIDFARLSDVAGHA